MSKASDDFSEFGRLLVNKLVEPSSKIHVYGYTLYVNVEIYILFQNFQVPTLFSLK